LAEVRAAAEVVVKMLAEAQEAAASVAAARPAFRALAAQLAAQARLNVPKGRKPMPAKGAVSRINRPSAKNTVPTKKVPGPRKVWLASRATVPRGDNVVAFPAPARAVGPQRSRIQRRAA
jgi:hypothetical protein